MVEGQNVRIPGPVMAMPASSLLKERSLYKDFFEGTAAQLVAAGLALEHQFPGMPGNTKGRATYFVADGAPVPRCAGRFERTYTICRMSSQRYAVEREVHPAERARRRGYQDAITIPCDEPSAPEEPLISPAWTPRGWAFRGFHAKTCTYVFVVQESDADIEALTEGRLKRGERLAKTLRFLSRRFGCTAIARRSATELFVETQAPSEVRCTRYQTGYFGRSPTHTGTKAQLIEHGIGTGLGFPGEPGCNVRMVTGVDGNGNKLRIELLHPSDWHGDTPRFDVRVLNRDKPLASDPPSSGLERSKRLRELQSLPATRAAFRDDMAKTFWAWALATKKLMQNQDGFRFAQDAVDDYMASVTDAYWCIKNGETVGIGPKQQLAALLAEGAKEDLPLQQMLNACEQAVKRLGPGRPELDGV